MSAVTPMRALVAFQLAVIVVAGTLTAAQFHVFSPIDEGAHLSYVQYVAEEHKLPVLEQDKVSPEILALSAGIYPNTKGLVPGPGLFGTSYEAFQPPLYYLVATPVYLLTPNHATKLTLLRLFGLALLLAAAFVLYRLARRVAPEGGHLVVFSAGLTVLMWPGVIVRGVTVSNAALELLLACVYLYTLWRADSEDSSKYVVGSGVVLGLGILTKFTFIALSPLLALVAVRYLLRRRDKRAVATTALAVVLPLVLLAPWLAFNLSEYDALTANSLARDMQRPVLNPQGNVYTLASLKAELPNLFDGFLPQEWLEVNAQQPLVGLALDFLKVVLFGLPLLLVLWAPRQAFSRETLLLAVPFLLGVAVIVGVSMFSNWPIVLPRYLYPMVPAFGLLAGLSALRLFDGRRPAAITFAASSVVLASLWIYLAGKYLVLDIGKSVGIG